MVGKSLKDFASLIGKKTEIQEKIAGFSFDSREVRPGFVFFALKGEKVDGHDYIEQAFARGAVAVVVSKEGYGDRAFVVSDTRKTLQELAKQQVEQLKPLVIGITGSVGKTTTKEFVSTLLSCRYKVAKTPGNQNSQVGLPLSILNWDFVPEVFVAEMGMTEEGEIARLVQIAPPSIALITKVALAHAEFFSEGIEGIAKAKAEILSQKQTKVAVLHRQVMEFTAFQKNKGPKKVFYGESEENRIEKEGDLYRLFLQGEKSSLFSLPFSQTHMVESFLAGATVAKKVGLSFEEITEGAKKLQPPERRFEQVRQDGVLFINDSYNAQPVSVKAALENLPKPAGKGRVVAVLSEMRELGEGSLQAHREIGQYAATYVDLLLCEGEGGKEMKEGFSALGKEVVHFSTIKDLKEALYHHIQSGDVVLLKGSKPAQLWTVLKTS